MFEETMKQFESLNFLRDSHGRWSPEIPEAGWYQNSAGELFKYDGVVWDVVPSERIDRLEYLG